MLGRQGRRGLGSMGGAGHPMWVGLALGCALLAQYCFVGPQRSLKAGVVLYIAAGVLFWRVLGCDDAEWRVSRESSTDCSQRSEESGRDSGEILHSAQNGSGGEEAILAEARGRASPVLLLLCVLCNLASLLLVTAESSLHADYWGAFWLWLASIAFFLVLIWAQAGRSLRLRSPAAHSEWLGVGALTALALTLRVGWLEEIPTLLAGDEAAMGLEALRVLDGTLRNMFATGWFSHPTMYFFVQALSVRLFGATVFALRVSSAVVGALTVPALYALGRQMWGRRVAWGAAVLLTAYHFHVHYSRLGLNNIEDGLFAVLAFLLLCRAVQGGDAVDYGLCGLVLGASQYFYWGARVLPLVSVVLLGWVWCRREPVHYPTRLARGLRKCRGTERKECGRMVWMALSLAGGFALVVSPLALYYVQHPGSYGARWGQVSILAAGRLAATAQATGTSLLAVLGEQCLRSVLAFHAYTDMSTLYGAPIPLLDYFAAVLFSLGLICVAMQRRHLGNILLMLWLGAVVLFGGVLLVDPPTSQRLVIASPALCLVIAVGLDRLLGLAQNPFEWEPSFTRGLFAFVLVVMLLGNVRYYFSQYTPGGFFLEANSEIADRAGRYVRSLDGDYRVYFAGAPRITFDSPAIVYLAGAPMGQDVLEPITGRPGFVDRTKKGVFIFTPERVGELGTVREHFPDGVVSEFRSRVWGPLFTAYEFE